MSPDSLDPMTLSSDVREDTVAERVEIGRRARKVRPRSGMGAFTPAPDRPDPVTLLGDQETVRLQALLPLRHERMSVSPFTFYRGSAVVMTNDLATMPNTGLVTQLCGDAHLSNFGMFAAPDRNVVFDINDFDETNPGPFEWDVYRLATSFALAGRDVHLTPDEISLATITSAIAYRTQMATYAAMPDLDVWYDRVSIEVLQQWAKDEGSKLAQKRVAFGASRARSRDMWSAIAKMTEVVDGRRQFKNLPPLLMRIPLDDDASVRMTGLLEQYQETLQPDRRQLLNRYHIIDFGHKVVGVGSVGLLAFVVLLQGRDESDLLVLQIKQAVQSVLEPYTGASEFDLCGQRVVVGQQLMQAASDVFLGWIRGPGGRDFYIRQLRDMKFAPDPTLFTSQTLTNFAMVCGRTLARAHARSGDAVAIASFLGTSAKFDTAVRDFALAYADQVAIDFAAYQAAIAAGTVALPQGDQGHSYRVVVSSSTGVSVVDESGAPAIT